MVDVLRRCYNYAIFRATCLAILLRHKLHEKLHGVTYTNDQVSQHFCCSKRCTKQNQDLLFATITATLQRIFEAWHSVTPLLQLVSQCFVRSANKNTPSTLTSSSEGQVARQVARNIAGCNTSAHATATKQIQLLRHKLHEKLHSVTPPLTYAPSSYRRTGEVWRV